VPEIDVPGHTTSWLVAHPEWGTLDETRTVSTRFGPHSACLDPTRDEVNPKWWQESAAVQRFMRDHGIADTDSLHDLFNERLADLLIDRGRMLMGWDEIAHGDLPRTSIVQSWRGGASRDRAVAQGFDCVFSAGYYLDFFYPADLHYAYDPESPSEELLRLDARVRADPRLAHVRDGLGWASEFAGRSAVDASSSDLPPGRVLGGEACMWAEIVNDEIFEGRVWGRLPAVAERLWSPRALRDEADMYLRLSQLRPMLAAFADVDIEARRRESFERIGVDAVELAGLRDLFDAIEPIKWYSRLLGSAALKARVAGSTEKVERPYAVATPLDRVPDLIEPASEWIPRFNAAVRAVIDDAGEAEDIALLEATAARWRRQRDVVGTVGARVPAIAELEEISAQLARLADVIDAGLARTLGESHRTLVAAAREPFGELLIAAVPALDEWLQA